MSELELLNKIYASNVLLVAARIKSDKKEKGVTSTGDYIREAVSLIGQTALRLSSSR